MRIVHSPLSGIAIHTGNVGCYSWPSPSWEVKGRGDGTRKCQKSLRFSCFLSIPLFAVNVWLVSRVPKKVDSDIFLLVYHCFSGGVDFWSSYFVTSADVPIRFLNEEMDSASQCWRQHLVSHFSLQTLCALQLHVRLPPCQTPSTSDSLPKRITHLVSDTV